MKKESMKSNKAVVFGASISFVLLVAIIGSIFYKMDQVSEPVEEERTPVAAEQIEEVEETVASVEEQPKVADSQVEQPEEVMAEVVEQPTSEESKGAEAPADNKPPKETEAPKEEAPVMKGGYIEGQKAPTEPTYIQGILIVNKKYPLPATYNKGEDKTAKAAYEKMAAAAKVEGIELVAFSGFRSYEYQTTLYTNYVKRDGQDKADRYSARPGHSEHQTGLAFDIGEKGREDLWLTSAFGETKAGQWLVQNAHQYGFILRYPEGKEAITGFMYESWHFRYLDVETATKVYESGLTLEEYLGIN